MTPDILFLLCVLFLMMVLFLTEALPIDFTSVLGLLVLLGTGYLTPNEAFQGFSSPTIITLVSMYFLGAALARTGVAESVALRVHRFVGNHELFNIGAVMLMGIGLSAFMNNVAAAAVLLPAVASIARYSDIAPSKLFIPLAYATVLGGMTTLIGTPPNILMSDVMRTSLGQQPFAFADYTPFGLSAAALGVLFVCFIGQRFLPERNVKSRAHRGKTDLATVYRLRERQFSLRIPEDSELVGKTLKESEFGSLLQIWVIGLVRDGRRNIMPGADTQLKAGDVLLIQGREDRLAELLRFRGVEVEDVEAGSIESLGSGYRAASFVVQQGEFVGKSLRAIHLRERYGVVAVAIERKGELLYRSLGTETLKEDDVLHVLGSNDVIAKLADDVHFWLLDDELSLVEFLENHMFSVRLPEDTPLAGIRICDTSMGQLLGLRAVGIIRERDVLLALEGREVLRAGDRLIVTGDRSEVVRLAKMGSVRIEPLARDAVVDSDEYAVVEAVMAPRSDIIGKTLAEIHFQERYQFQALALWRDGDPIRSELSTIPLRLGDSLLLYGLRRRLPRIAESDNFVTLSTQLGPPRKKGKAVFAILALLIMIFLSAYNVQPVHVAAFLAAVFAVASGTLSMEEGYKAVSWRIVVLVASLIPLGVALENSGTALYFADQILQFTGSLGPVAALVVLCLLSSLFSQTLDGAVAVILLAPVAMQVAHKLEVAPQAFLMGVALSASIAFLTPFSHKANLLVMGAGGYRNIDYFKIGWPLTFLLLVLFSYMLPIVYPF